MSSINPVPGPSTPDPTMQTLIYTLLRAILTIMGAVGIGVGANLNDGTLMIIAGAVATIIGVGWSVYEKFQAARKQHDAAITSAALQRPVNPT